MSTVAAPAKGRGTAAWALVWLLLWVPLLSFPSYVAGPNLDHSWQQSYAYFLKHRLQAGQDYLFTYGPLSYFLTDAYDADLFPLRFGWELLIKGVLVFQIVGLLRESCGRSRLVLILALLPLIVLGWGIADVTYLLVAVLALRTLITSEELHPGVQAGLAFLLAFISLIKAVQLVFCLLGVLMAEVVVRRRRPRALVSPLSLYLGWLLGLWLLAGQNLRHLPAYLAGLAEMTRGYAEAMVRSTSSIEVLFSGVVLLLLGGALLWLLFRVRRDAAGAALVILLGVSILLVWKLSFTRHGIGRAQIFFIYALLAPFLIPRPVRVSAGRYMSSALATVVVLSLGGAAYACVQEDGPSGTLGKTVRHYLGNWHSLVNPGGLRSELEQQRAAMAREFDLPRVRERVGTRSIDVMSFEQGVLLLNRFRWTPRPVFQGYAAYSPGLLARNAAFFAGEQAPEFVLFKLQTIDRRLPAQEDAEALLVLLARYTPVLLEKGYVLLERQAGGAPRLVPWEQRSVRFGESVEVPAAASAVKVSLDFRPSFPGKLLQLLYKPQEVGIEITTEAGRVESFRLVPGIARSGFLINPLLVDTEDVVRLYGLSPRERVRSFRVKARESGSGPWFEDRVDVNLQTLQTPAEAPSHLERLLNEMSSND